MTAKNIQESRVSTHYQNRQAESFKSWVEPVACEDGPALHSCEQPRTYMPCFGCCSLCGQIGQHKRIVFVYQDFFNHQDFNKNFIGYSDSH